MGPGSSRVFDFPLSELLYELCRAGTYAKGLQKGPAQIPAG